MPFKSKEAKREYMRQYNRHYYEQNKERVKEKVKSYKTQKQNGHFFQWRAYRISNRLGAKIKAEELRRLWKEQRGRCALTGEKLGRDAELDHIQPKSKGGKTEIGNLRWLSPEANRMKHNMNDEILVKMCIKILENQK